MEVACVGDVVDVNVEGHCAVDSYSIDARLRTLASVGFDADGLEVKSLKCASVKYTA